jgi:putative flippase GtrA
MMGPRLAEVSKFGAVGAAAYLMTVIVSNALRFGPPNLGPVTSLACAVFVAASFSYFANRHWTWRDKQRRGVAREYSLFVVLSTAGLLLTELPVVVAEYLLHQHSPLAYNVAGNLVGTLLGTAWRFWAFKRWVFRDREPTGTVGPTREAVLELR